MIISMDCTACMHVFKISAKTLSIMGGRARCPECGEVMRAEDNQAPTPDLTQPALGVAPQVPASLPLAAQNLQEEATLADHTTWLSDLSEKIEAVTDSKLSLGEPIIGSSANWQSLSESSLPSLAHTKQGDATDFASENDEQWLAQLVAEVNTPSALTPPKRSTVPTPTLQRMNVFSSLNHVQGTTASPFGDDPVDDNSTTRFSARTTQMIRVAQTPTKPPFFKKSGTQHIGALQRILMLGVIVLLLCALLLQYYFLNQARLTDTVIGRVMQSTVCPVLGCTHAIPTTLAIKNVVFKWGESPKSIIVEATIYNSANYAVTLPSIKLLLPNAVGVRLLPGQYLAPALSGVRRMLPNSSLPLAFTLNDVDTGSLQQLRFEIGETYPD